MTLNKVLGALLLGNVLMGIALWLPAAPEAKAQVTATPRVESNNPFEVRRVKADKHTVIRLIDRETNIACYSNDMASSPWSCAPIQPEK